MNDAEIAQMRSDIEGIRKQLSCFQRQLEYVHDALVASIDADTYLSQRSDSVIRLIQLVEGRVDTLNLRVDGLDKQFGFLSDVFTRNRLNSESPYGRL